MKQCNITGCDRPHSAKGLCKTHYTARRMRTNQKPCQIDGCDGKVFARNWCMAHYEQHRRGLTPGERSLKRERQPVEPYLDGLEELCSRMTITAAAELLVVDPATIYRWRKGKQSTITPEQADRLVMETGPIVDDSADVTSFAFSDEGRKLIEEMRGF